MKALFLNEKDDFPGKEWGSWFDKYREYGAWYSGEQDQLLQYYGVKAEQASLNKFWKRINKNNRDGIVHLPAASDVCDTSAKLLFAESPRLTFDKGTAGGERIVNFMTENGFLNVLLESAELSAAFSGVFLKLDLDRELSEYPIVSIITPLQAFPMFRRGRLSEVCFYREVKRVENANKIYRLFENRRLENKKLIIEYQLHEGTNGKVGRQIGLNSIDETKDLILDPVDLGNVGGLGCVYIPNMRPNKILPGSPLGANDFSQSIPLMDSLDFAWSSWMRDIELGYGKVFVDTELLNFQKEQGDLSVTSGFFDTFEKAFIKLNMSDWRLGGESGTKPIENVQFDIRTEDHRKACDALFYQIVNNCGYSPQTFGLGDFGRAESGTALRIREHKSQLTREKKSRYWTPALMSLLYQAQLIDQYESKKYTPEEIDIELEDSILIDSKEVSEVLRNLDQAEAISTYLKVKTLHPEWEEENIKEEVDKIIKEKGIQSDFLEDNEPPVNYDTEEKDEENNKEDDSNKK